MLAVMIMTNGKLKTHIEGSRAHSTCCIIAEISMIPNLTPPMKILLMLTKAGNGYRAIYRHS